MKKFFSLLAAALFTLPMLAEVYTITISGSSTSITSQGISLSADKAAGQNDPVVNNNTSTGEVDYRVYAGSTFTVSCSQTITSINFTLSTKGVQRQATLTPSTGTMTQTNAGTTAAWAGSASSITFTVGAKADYGTDGNTKAGQFDFTQLVVTTDGSVPPTPTDPVTPPTGGNVTISGLAYADAYLWSYNGFDFLDIDLYKDFDYEVGLTFPEVYLQMEAKSMTAIAGTYDLFYAGYWKSANDSVETDLDAESTVGTLTITYSNGAYTLAGSFTATDGKTYTFNCTPELAAYDDDYDEITLTEQGGTTPPVVNPGSVISVAEALAIGNALADNATTAETYVVEGYVAKLAGTYNTQYNDQSFFMSDIKGDASDHFDFEVYQGKIDAPGVIVGDKVRITGQITKYVKNGSVTIEIKKGTVEIISQTALEDVEGAAEVKKTIINGRLIIEHNGARYDALGTKL